MTLVTYVLVFLFLLICSMTHAHCHGHVAFVTLFTCLISIKMVSVISIQL